MLRFVFKFVLFHSNVKAKLKAGRYPTFKINGQSRAFLVVAITVEFLYLHYWAP